MDTSDESPLESLLFKKPPFNHLISDHHHHHHHQHQNPITISNKQQDDEQIPNPFFSDFPSPFFDEHELPLNQILPHYNPILMEPHPKAPNQTETKNFTHSTKKETSKRGLKPSKLKEKAENQALIKKRNLGVVPRKRAGKKDRHSKICTAQGIRDRRMRLSLQVARKFFDLQDMLGYDKASTTIEWLFSKSKKAIKDLMAKENDINPQANNNNNYHNYNLSSILSDAKSESFLSECEVVSGVEVSSNNEILMINNRASPNLLGIVEKNEKKMLRKPTCKPNLRELREMARARARWRTREKLMIKQWSNFCSPNYENDFQKLGLQNSPFEGVDHHQESENRAPIVQQQLSHDVGTIEKLLGNSSLLSTSSDNYCPNNISDHNCYNPNSNFMGFLGNWDLLNNERLNYSHTSAVTNDQVSMAGNDDNNPSSIYSATTSNFPLFHQ